MKTLTNLALVALLMTSTSVFANAAPHEHHHNNAAPQEKAHTYVCPMHPEVTGNKDDTCPKCGMNLEPKATTEKKTDAAAHKDHAHH